MGLLRIPEEMQPPDVLARANRVMQETAADTPPVQGMLRLLAEPELLEAHRRMMPPATPRRAHAVDVALAVAHARLDLAQSPAEALAAMTQAEQTACLSDPVSLDKLVALGALEMAAASHQAQARA
jgi:membrane glycosyltransferase